ncbi:MAG: T9SS type A sorting domain-containing protein [Candidatus Eisenbacteria bacterium]|nr:T9SS type A sorting domain-containing protein [Candidatus Eisenbacteria bacterium]
MNRYQAKLGRVLRQHAGMVRNRPPESAAPSLLRSLALGLGLTSAFLAAPPARAQHLSPDGMVLRLQNTAVVTVWQGVVNGKFDLPATVSSGRIDVSFLDENGVEFTPTDPIYSLRWNAPNPVIATISQLDDWAFHLTGVNPGVSTLQIKIWHEDHADWTSAVIPVRTVGTTSVEPRRGATLALSAPMPNPARNRASVRFSLPSEAGVDLSLYDPSGRFVRALARGGFDSGVHHVDLDLSGLAGGIYYLQLSAGGERRAESVLILE